MRNPFTFRDPGSNPELLFSQQMRGTGSSHLFHCCVVCLHLWHAATHRPYAVIIICRSHHSTVLQQTETLAPSLMLRSTGNGASLPGQAEIRLGGRQRFPTARACAVAAFRVRGYGTQGLQEGTALCEVWSPQAEDGELPGPQGPRETTASPHCQGKKLFP